MAIKGPIEQIEAESKALFTYLKADPLWANTPLKREHILAPYQAERNLEKDGIIRNLQFAIYLANGTCPFSVLTNNPDRYWIAEQALDIAIFTNKYTELLLDNFKRMSDQEQEEAFVLAAKRGHEKVVECLLRFGFSDNAYRKAIDVSGKKIAAIIISDRPRIVPEQALKVVLNIEQEIKVQEVQDSLNNMILAVTSPNFSEEEFLKAPPTLTPGRQSQQAAKALQPNVVSGDLQNKRNPFVSKF